MATTIKDADDFKDSALLVAVKRIAYFSCIYFFIIIYSLTFRSLVSEAGTVNSEHVTNLSLGTSGNVVQRTSCHWSCGAHLFYFYVGNFYLVFYQLFCAILFYIFFSFRLPEVSIDTVMLHWVLKFLMVKKEKKRKKKVFSTWIKWTKLSANCSVKCLEENCELICN